MREKSPIHCISCSTTLYVGEKGPECESCAYRRKYKLRKVKHGRG